jgi:hypothetical protein
MVRLATSRYQATDLICASGLVPVGITVGRPRCLDGIGIEVFQRRFAEISGAQDGRGLVFLCREVQPSGSNPGGPINALVALCPRLLLRRPSVRRAVAGSRRRRALRCGAELRAAAR